MFLCFLFYIALGVGLFYFFKLDSSIILFIYEKYFPNKEKLRSKIVWIVGSSTGIGEELAYKFAELNCRLILTSTTASKLEEVKKNCIQKSNNQLKEDDILVLPYDISDFKENDVAFEKIIEKFGNIDILCSNAARLMRQKVVDINIDEQRQLMDINFYAPMYITKIVIKHWIKLNFAGQILATSSIANYGDLPFMYTYFATKKALTTFYRAVEYEHKKNNIKVTMVFPGPVQTEISKKSLTKNLPSHLPNSVMTSERCSELMIISLANNLSEPWLCIQPYLAFIYIQDHLNFFVHKLFSLTNLVNFFEKQLDKRVEIDPN